MINDLSKAKSFLKNEIDFGIVWISGDPESVIYCYADVVEKGFKELIKKCIKKTVPRKWPDGYYTISHNEKEFNATRFSYLKDHPDAFPELDELRQLESYTEKHTKRVKKDMEHLTPCIIYEDRRNIWSDANSLYRNPQDARVFFNKIAKEHLDSQYDVVWDNEHLFYIYSKQTPSWAIAKVSLILS